MFPDDMKLTVRQIRWHHGVTGCTITIARARPFITAIITVIITITTPRVENTLRAIEALELARQASLGLKNQHKIRTIYYSIHVSFRNPFLFR